MEPKINNSYESEPSSGNSNGSSIDTLTMGSHELDVSPKLNALLAGLSSAAGAVASAGPDDGDAPGRTSDGLMRRIVSEAADRERVERAKLYFQRVCAERQQQMPDYEFGVRTPGSAARTPLDQMTIAGGGGSIGSRSNGDSKSSCASKGSSSIASGYSQRTMMTSAAATAGAPSEPQSLDGPDDESDSCDSEDDDDLSSVSVYSIEPTSSRDSDLDDEDDEDATASRSSAGQRQPTAVPVAFVTENSCNAVDQHRFADVTVSSPMRQNAPLDERSESARQVSFDGCIRTLAKPVESAAESQPAIDPMLSSSFNRTMQAHNEQSPDLFRESSDDEDEPDDRNDEAASDCYADGLLQKQPPAEGTAVNEARAQIHGDEKIVLGRIQTALSGLLPPPSVTILQYDILELLSMYKQNVVRLDEPGGPFVPLACVDGGPSLFRPTHSTDGVQQLQWPHTQDARAHGVHFNRSECSENVELLCMRFAERNIGAETRSTFSVQSPSSCKKRSMRLKQLTKSPGNRLSHLARRRAVFSSANLLNKSSSASAATIESSKLGNKPLLIDTRSTQSRRGRASLATSSSRIRTPKRRTPGGRKARTPGRRTPGSSRKRLTFGGAVGGLMMPAAASGAVGATSATSAATIKPLVPATRETSKRALFQSPPQEKPAAPRPIFPANVAHRVERSKRVLFSPLPPSHRAASSSLCVPETPERGDDSRGSALGGIRRQMSFGSDSQPDGHFQVPPKRKRDDGDDENSGTSHSTDGGGAAFGRMAKMPRLHSSAAINLDNLTPRTARLAKSQSFSVSAATGTEFRAAAALNRATSEQTIGSASPLLSDLHKKKIFWATATALNSKKIGSQHPQYKQYASVLAKVIKRLYLELPVERRSESTSTLMLKIAEKHVFWVLQGRTEDEIYLNEKQRTADQLGARLTKVTGYVAPEEYELRKTLLMRSRSGNQSSVFGGAFAMGAGPTSASQHSNGADSLFGSQNERQTPTGSQSSVTASQIASGVVAESSTAGVNLSGIDLGALCSDHQRMLQLSAGKQRLPIAVQSSGSTSKSNTKTGALRENDQRLNKSGQKAVFSGRDQKNVVVGLKSPFGVKAAASVAAPPPLMCASSLVGVSAIMKAKRQISFDS